MSKNSIKRVFVSVFLSVLTGITVFSGYQSAVLGLSVGWMGVFLTSAPLMLMLGRAFVMSNLARTSERLPLITGLGILGVLLAAYATFNAGGLLVLGLALVSFVGVQVYNYWYSDLSRTASPFLQEGESLPEFTVYQPDGSPFSSKDLVGKPALILFYRGNWCPLCMAQIKEIAAQYRHMADRGIEVLLISPQPESQTQQLADKFEVPFKFLVDRNNQAAVQLQIAMVNGLPLGLEALGYEGDTVFPTAIAVDASGVIIYSDQTSNYRVRPEPEDYLSVYAAHGI